MSKIRSMPWFKLTIIAIGAPVFLSVALMFITQAATPEDFAHPTNLSRTAKIDRESGAPEIARKGSTFAVVWSDGFAAGIGSNVKSFGHIMLANADENDGYWRPRLNVFTATATHWGAEPAIIFDQASGSKTVHIVWSDVNATDVNSLAFPAIKYAQCDVSGDQPSCTAPVTIASASGVGYRNPDIAQDASGNLHVVWTDEVNNKIYYSRGTPPFSIGDWSDEQIVGAAIGGKSPQLVYSNGRLHMVWVNGDTTGISYLYDSDTSDNFLQADGYHSWQADSGTFAGGKVGHPELVALGDLLFLTFDIRDPSAVDTDEESNFFLVYARSTNNGGGWTSYKGIPDPEENLPYPAFGQSDIYPSDNSNVSGGLQPSLAITTSTSATHLNIAWHYIYDDPNGTGPTHQVFHTWVDVDPTDNFTATWYTPPYTVTNPPTPTPEPEGRIPPAMNGSQRINGADSNPSVAPALAVTYPADGGLGKLHAVYLERAADNAAWDVYYRGFIAGTIDPLYLQDEDMFQMTNEVQPTRIVTSAEKLPPQTLAYTITLANIGDSNAIGVHITDTFNIPTSDITVVAHNANTGTLTFDAGTNTLLWAGDIALNTTVLITMTAVTKDQLDLPVTVVNSAKLWNKGSGGNVVLTRNGITYMQQYTIYLPLVMK